MSNIDDRRSSTAEAVGAVQSVDRALAILELLALYWSKTRLLALIWAFTLSAGIR